MATVAVLSPHLDDVVFSCWHVLRSSHDVVVINVFTAVPAAGTAPPRWDRITAADGPAERMRLRLEEDAAALAIAGRRAENLGFVDSQYHDSAPTGRERLPTGAEVIAPASIGGHSDHELVRDVGLALTSEGRRVSLYADLPYATEFGWPVWSPAKTPTRSWTSTRTGHATSPRDTSLRSSSCPKRSSDRRSVRCAPIGASSPRWTEASSEGRRIRT